MRLLLTGASGFLGRHLLPKLRDHSLRLLALPNDPAQALLRQEGELVIADLTRPETLGPAVEGVTHVVHLAAYVNGGRGPETRFMAVNAAGTEHLANASKSAGISHFIYAGSITVYAHADNAREDTPLVPTPGYAASKIQAEKALQRLLPDQTTILRLPLLLGAGDTGFMQPLIQRVRRTGRVPIIGDGRQPWSVLSVDDAARAIVMCLDMPETRGQAFNVVGETIPNGAMFEAIAGAMGTKLTRIPYVVARLIAMMSDMFGAEALTRAQVAAFNRPLSMCGDRFRELGFEPKTRFRDAIREGTALRSDD